MGGVKNLGQGGQLCRDQRSIGSTHQLPKVIGAHGRGGKHGTEGYIQYSVVSNKCACTLIQMHWSSGSHESHGHYEIFCLNRVIRD